MHRRRGGRYKTETSLDEPWFGAATIRSGPPPDQISLLENPRFLTLTYSDASRSGGSNQNIPSRRGIGAGVAGRVRIVGCQMTSGKIPCRGSRSQRARAQMKGFCFPAEHGRVAPPI